jgi:hypothetical protein
MYMMEGEIKVAAEPLSVVPVPYDESLCGSNIQIDHFLENIERRLPEPDIRRDYNGSNQPQYNRVINHFIRSNPQIESLITCLCTKGFIDCTDRPKGYLTFVVHGGYNTENNELIKKQLLGPTNVTLFAPIGYPNCGVDISRTNTSGMPRESALDLSRETVAYKTLLEGSESLHIFNIINQGRGYAPIGGLTLDFRESSSLPRLLDKVNIYSISTEDQAITPDEIKNAVDYYMQVNTKYKGKRTDYITDKREYLIKSTLRRAEIINHPLSYLSGNIEEIYEKTISYSDKPGRIFLDGPSVILIIKFKNKTNPKGLLPYIIINLFSQYNEDGTTPDITPTTNATIINISHGIINVIKELMKELMTNEICCRDKSYSDNDDLHTQLHVIDGSCGVIKNQRIITPDRIDAFGQQINTMFQRSPVATQQEISEEEEEKSQDTEKTQSSQPYTQEYSVETPDEEITEILYQLPTFKMFKINSMINDLYVPCEKMEKLKLEQKLNLILQAKSLKAKKSMQKYPINIGGTRLRIARHSQRRQRRNRLSTFREKSKFRSRMRSRVRSRAKPNSRTRRRRRQHNSSRSKRRKYVQ